MSAEVPWESKSRRAASARAGSTTPFSARASTAQGQTRSQLRVVDSFERRFEVIVDRLGGVVVDGVTESLELGNEQLGEGHLKAEMPFGKVEHRVEEVA